jgi:hypothetical protein
MATCVFGVISAYVFILPLVFLAVAVLGIGLLVGFLIRSACTALKNNHRRQADHGRPRGGTDRPACRLRPTRQDRSRDRV